MSDQHDEMSESAAPEPRPLTAEEEAQLAELDDQLEKFEGQKRWSDVIRTILAKADIVQDPAVKIELLRQAGTMYVERSSNQAEAIKCFEQVLELSPQDVEAMTRLREMYEKRRDWESLIGIMEREAEMLDEADRALRYVEMAELATARLRKPDICIGIWKKVLQYEPGHKDALENLATLYERAREWEPLAEVLERVTDFGGDDEKQLKQQLQKLGCGQQRLQQHSSGKQLELTSAAILRLSSSRMNSRGRRMRSSSRLQAAAAA